MSNRLCDSCEHEFGEWCTHPSIKEAENSDRPNTNMIGDLWNEEETPKWCPLTHTPQVWRKAIDELLSPRKK